jgi:protein-S-isoprenylcysteine O-methyltransferase Ste14
MTVGAIDTLTAVSALRTAILIAWVVFWAYWLIAAAGATRGSQRMRARPPGLIIAVLAVVLLRIFRTGGLAVRSPVLEGVGTLLFVTGLATAVWARLHLGRNWGMPMTTKSDPELVTSGPYRLIRHPIYSGILLGLLGTALATDLYWLIVAGVMGVYFLYSAKVEERLMTAAFPSAYPSYRARTKMLIPFVL